MPLLQVRLMMHGLFSEYGAAQAACIVPRPLAGGPFNSVTGANPSPLSKNAPDQIARHHRSAPQEAKAGRPRP